MTNDPLATLLPVLADTMKFATQALAQSTALAKLRSSLQESRVQTRSPISSELPGCEPD